MPSSQTTAAVWTPWGRGAVASIRVYGDLSALAQRLETRLRLASGESWPAVPSHQIRFGRWGSDPAEDVVICRIDERTIEVHCHGGNAASTRILADLAAADCTACDWQEQFSAATCRLDCEHVQALARATTWRAGAWLASQAGRLTRVVELLENDVARNEWATAHARLQAILEWAQFGRHLTEPWAIVIGGRPNVGKSSLINALAGFERSIVFDQPGTTRDVVSVTTALNGWPVQFSDTAGLRGADDELEAAGIERARHALANADVRVLLFDISQPPHVEDRALMAGWPDAIVVAHKCDLPNVWRDEMPPPALRVSSLRGVGLADLTDTIAQRLVPRLPPADAIIPITQRQTFVLTGLQHALDARDHRAINAAIAELRG